VRFSGSAGQRVSGAAVSGQSTAFATATTAPPPRGPADPLNINTATASELDALPGIGPTKAAAILQYRQERGPFAAVDELARVPGFGAAAVARLRDRVSAR
jgi:competence protein ComEA